LNCGGGETQLGPSAGISAGFLARALGHPGASPTLQEFLPIQDSAAANLSNSIAHFALDFSRQESVCGWHGQRA
jgi:hypothetical protein